MVPWSDAGSLLGARVWRDWGVARSCECLVGGTVQYGRPQSLRRRQPPANYATLVYGLLGYRARADCHANQLFLVEFLLRAQLCAAAGRLRREREGRMLA